MSTAAQFLSVVRQSRLIPEAILEAEAERLGWASKDGDGDSQVTIAELARHLIRRGLLTGWQTEKLLAGKHKGFFLGKYKLLQPLGAGGMSFVYLAENQWLGQRRAIKVLPKSKVADSSFLERFYREARAAAQLDHPHIVRTYDIDQQGDQHFMVMEYVEGEDLTTVVKRGGPLEPALAAEYLRQAALALQHAHQAGLIHRDVKPGNLLLNRQGHVKLLDLGLAKFSQQTSDLTIVHNETLMGTADYLSPEQALNSHLVDLRTDIYSLGGTLYFLIAGHPPFPEGTVAQRLVRHQSVDPPTLQSLRADCPLFLSQLCQWMMRKPLDERCRDCGEVLAWLEKWRADPQWHWPAEPWNLAAGSVVKPAAGTGSSGKGGAAAAAPPAKPSPKSSPRRRADHSGYWVLGSLVVLLIVSLLLLWFAFQSIQSAQTRGPAREALGDLV
jgi:serine/threonine-protein kinase